MPSLAWRKQLGVGIHRRAADNQPRGGIVRIVLDHRENAARLQHAARLGGQTIAQLRFDVMIDAHRRDQIEAAVFERDTRWRRSARAP